MKQYIKNKVSVIMPVYNSELFLIDSVLSIINQTYKNLEIIIVDDNSSDKSKEIILDLASNFNYIKPIFLNENVGVAEARNIGIKQATGQFIAFLDSDDIWNNEKLEKQITFMNDKNVGITCCSYNFIDEYNNVLCKTVNVSKKITYSDLIKYNTIGCLTVVYDREKIGEVYMQNKKHEDYLMWLNITKKGFDIYALEPILASYRKRKKSISSNKIKAAKWTWNILRKEENLPIFKAYYCFCIYAIKNIKKHIL